MFYPFFFTITCPFFPFLYYVLPVGSAVSEVISTTWLPTISLCNTLFSPCISTMSYPFFPFSTIIILLFLSLLCFLHYLALSLLLSLYNLLPVGSAVSARWSVPSDSPLSRRPFLWIMALCLTALLADDSWGDTE